MHNIIHGVPTLVPPLLHGKYDCRMSSKLVALQQGRISSTQGDSEQCGKKKLRERTYISDVPFCGSSATGCCWC